MRVALIWPYVQAASTGFHLFPVAYSYLAPSLKNHDVHIVDCVLHSLLPDSTEFLERIATINPDVIGVSWWSNNTPCIKTTIQGEVFQSFYDEAIGKESAKIGGIGLAQYIEAKLREDEVILSREGKME